MYKRADDLLDFFSWRNGKAWLGTAQAFGCLSVIDDCSISACRRLASFYAQCTFHVIWSYQLFCLRSGTRNAESERDQEVGRRGAQAEGGETRLLRVGYIWPWSWLAFYQPSSNNHRAMLRC